MAIPILTEEQKITKTDLPEILRIARYLWDLKLNAQVVEPFKGDIFPEGIEFRGEVSPVILRRAPGFDYAYCDIVGGRRIQTQNIRKEKNDQLVPNARAFWRAHDKGEKFELTWILRSGMRAKILRIHRTREWMGFYNLGPEKLIYTEYDKRPTDHLIPQPW